MTNEKDGKYLQSELIKVMRRIKKIKSNVSLEPLIYTEYNALELISRYTREHPGAPGIYVSELAGSMGIAPSAASRLLNAMEGKGFIAREVDAGDRRNTFVRLTPEGKEVFGRVAGEMEFLRERYVERMGYEDISELIKLWNKLADIMEEELSLLEQSREREREERQ